MDRQLALSNRTLLCDNVSFLLYELQLYSHTHTHITSISYNFTTYLDMHSKSILFFAYVASLIVFIWALYENEKI